jgi:hypothetical protein
MTKPARPRGMGPRTAALVGLLAWSLLAGCADDTGVTRGQEAERTYSGPLYVARDAATHPRAGAAGDVVDCDTWGSGGLNDQEVYGDGATADSPEQALEVARGEGAFGGVQEGLTVAATEDDRVLYVVEVDGVVKQAVVVHDGPATEGAGGDGWYVESWAHCDYAELPQSLADSLGLQVWSDAAGRPVPTSTVASWRGSSHCDWQSMTFLVLGKATYVRAPQPDLEEYFAEPYVEHADLPATAVDTGFEHDGEHLWLSPDRQRAFVGTADDVELWPRTVQPLGCA